MRKGRPQLLVGNGRARLPHHAHFRSKGGLQPFSAVNTNGCNAQIATFANVT